MTGQTCERCQLSFLSGHFKQVCPIFIVKVFTSVVELSTIILVIM